MTTNELHQLLDRAAPEPPAGSGPRQFDTGDRRFHPWLVPIAAAVTVLLVAALALVVTHASRRANPPAAPAVPAGQKLVVFHGLSLTVPDSFTVGPGSFGCGPTFNTVQLEVGGGAPSCPYFPPSDPPGTTVNLLPADSMVLTSDDHPVTIDGKPAWLRVVTDESRPALILTDRTTQTQVQVSAPTLAAARAIIDTAHHTGVDERGCAVDFTGTDDNAPADAILPDRPTSAVSCVYDDDHLLVGSGRLSSSELAALATTIEHGTAVPDPPGLPYPVETVRYVVHLADGTTRIVYARAWDSPELASDGQRTVAIANGGLPVAYQ